MSIAGRRRWRTLGLTVLGAGFLRPAPGSWGSLIAALAWLGWLRLSEHFAVPPLIRELAVCLAVVVSVSLCVRWGGWAALRFGSDDPRECVLDEFAGQLVALSFLPAFGGHELLFVGAGQFLLFRALDVVKPPPSRWLEHLPAGWGIVADDLVAGAYANLVGQLIWRTGLSSWCVAAFWALLTGT